MSPDPVSNQSESHALALGSDHAGFELKQELKKVLTDLGVGWQDMGTDSTESCDYPDYARKVAESVSQGSAARGILCCGSGIGVSIVANKVRKVRAALCHDVESARLSRQHNDANVLCLGARTTDPALVADIVKAFLSTQFEGGRHQRRVDKIEQPRASDHS